MTALFAARNSLRLVGVFRVDWLGEVLKFNLLMAAFSFPVFITFTAE
jgi:hypothetical protein